MTNIFQSIINTIYNYDRYAWINIFTTVLFFYVIQTLFFKYIASNQYNNLLLQKARFLTKLGKYNTSIAALIEEMKKNAEVNLKTKALESQKIRERINKRLIFNYCVIPIIVVSSILLLIVIYSLFTKSKKSWSYIETISFILILGSYLTELYFFFFMVQKYEIVSDDELTYKLFKHLNNTIEEKINTIDFNKTTTTTSIIPNNTNSPFNTNILNTNTLFDTTTPLNISS